MKADEADVRGMQDFIEDCRLCWLLHGGGARVSAASAEFERCVKLAALAIFGVALAVGSVPTAIGGLAFTVVMTVGPALLGPMLDNVSEQLRRAGISWEEEIRYPDAVRRAASEGELTLKVQSTNSAALRFEFDGDGDLAFHFGRAEGRSCRVPSRWGLWSCPIRPVPRLFRRCPWPRSSGSARAWWWPGWSGCDGGPEREGVDADT